MKENTMCVACVVCSVEVAKAAAQYTGLSKDVEEVSQEGAHNLATLLGKDRDNIFDKRQPFFETEHHQKGNKPVREGK